MAKKAKGPLKGNAVKHLNKRLGKLAKRGKLSEDAKRRLFSIRDQRHVGARERNIQVADDTTEARRMRRRDMDAFHNVASDSDDDAPLDDGDAKTRAPAPPKGATPTYASDSEEEVLPLDMLSDDDVEGEEGMQKRQFANERLQNALRHLLPTKNERGKLVMHTTPKTAVPDVAPAVREETMDDDDAEQDGDDALVNDAEPVIKSVDECRMRIATLCQHIIQAPQDNMRKLRSLHAIAVGATVLPSCRYMACKLATVSLMQVYVDIIPAYTIRSGGTDDDDAGAATQTKAKEAVKMRKETKSLVGFETALLRNYRKYLQHLHALVDYAIPAASRPPAKDDDGERAVKYAHMASRCAVTLLARVPHFNYTSNVVAMIVPLANSPIEPVRTECCTGMRALFATCATPAVARCVLQITRAFNTYITQYQSNLSKMVHADAMALFEHINIKQVDYEDAAGKTRRSAVAKAKKHMNKKQRKYTKQLDALASELKETEATERKEDRLRVHTLTMTQVFHIYFRILRRHTRTALLSPILSALATHAHLVNVDFVNDILDVLHALVEDRTISLWDSARALHTACQLFTADLMSTAISVDPSRFYSALYRLMPVLTERTIANAADTSCMNAWRICIDCVYRLTITRRRHISAARAAAFVKRSTLLALIVPNRSIVTALLLLVRHIISSNSTLIGLVDDECEESAGGTMMIGGRANVAGDDPDHANALHMHIRQELTLMAAHTPLAADGRSIATHLLHALPVNGVHALERHIIDKYSAYLSEPGVVDEVMAPVVRLSKTANKKAKSASVHATHLCYRVVSQLAGGTL